MNSPVTESLSRAQYIVFSLDGEEYALPITDSKEVLRTPEISEVPNSPSFIEGIINLRGEVISVVNLEELFGLERSSELSPEHIIVSDVGGVAFGILVDEVVEVLRVNEKSVRPAPATVSSKIGKAFIGGVLVFDDEESSKEHEQDDRVILILNLANVMSEDEVAHVERANNSK